MAKAAESGDDTFDFAVRSDHACFGCGDQNPIGLHLRFGPAEDGVQATFVPEPEHQGFENVIHGGIITTVLDEAMAWATAYAGHWAVTGEMRIRFRRPLNVGESTIVTARVSGCRGRIISTTAELSRVGESTPVATASGTFMKVNEDVESAWRARYLTCQAASDPGVPQAPLVVDGNEPRE